MSATLVEAVGTDRFGGLTGFKRPLSGNPTRVPSNLPSFRGASHRPGDPTIRTPAIRSSANKPDRKTNILIPYARLCPLDNAHEIGRASPGDVIFLSKARPGLPGYAHSRFSRVVGIDFLNRFLGKDFWKDTTSASGGGTTYAHILVDAVKVADDWRKVPFLTEWSLDGIVLSNDQPEAFYSDSASSRDGQLFNVGIQGVCAVNNGFVDEKGMGQLARDAGALFAPGFMDHRTEVFSNEKTQNSQRFDFAAMYQGPQYHLYPLQMFDRQIRPMQDLFVGLVATSFEAPPKALLDGYDQVLTGKAAAAAVLRSRKAALDAAAGDPAKQQARNRVFAAKATLQAASDAIEAYETANLDLQEALKNRGAFQAMDWWDESANQPKTGTGVPTKNFHTFKFITFSSGQLWDLDNTIDIMTPAGEPRMSKRRKLDSDPYEPEQKFEDLRRLVGAWHIGKVLDMKAAKMPYFEGGPMETGYRVTVNVNIEWWDWRKLRKTYTSTPGAAQVADKLKGPGMAKFDAGVEATKREHGLVLQWPTAFNSALYKDRPTSGDPEATKDFYEANTGVPVNPDDFYAGRPIDKRTQRADYLSSYYQQEVEAAAALPSAEPDDGSELLPPLFEARAAKLPKLPTLPALGGEISDDHERQVRAHLELAVQNLGALLAPPTSAELAALGVRRRPTVPGAAGAARVAAAPAAASSSFSLPPMVSACTVACATTPGACAPAPAACAPAPAACAMPAVVQATTAASAAGPSASGAAAAPVDVRSKVIAPSISCQKREGSR